MTQEIVEAGIVATASNESKALTITKEDTITARGGAAAVNGAGHAGLDFKSLYLNSAQNADGLNPADDDLDQYFAAGQSMEVEFAMKPDDYPQMIKDAEIIFGNVVGDDVFMGLPSNEDQDPWNPLGVKTYATPEKPNRHIPLVKILDEDEMNQMRLEENVDFEILDLTETGRNAVVKELLFQQI